jgi:mRNA interferase MazF
VNLHRGEVWYADIPGGKRRPVVLLTRDSVLPRMRSILVAPITSTIRSIPTEVPIASMTRPSVANLDNITLIDITHLVQRVGRITQEESDAICSAARFAIGC